MSDNDTFTRGTELGFEGMDFYVAGRGGALGDVPADVVVAAFWSFGPEAVRDAWNRTATVTTRREAAGAWLACGHRWAMRRFDDGPDYERAAALLGRIVSGASVACAPLFAGVRSLPEPTDPKALVQHRLNAVRELRGALHGAAVLTVGLQPHEAVAVRTPKFASVAGWPEPHPDPEPLRDRWALAEARTDRMVGRHYAVLDDGERTELVGILDAIRAALS